MARFRLENVPIEMCDGLKTKPIPIPFLERGAYVFLSEDIDIDDEIPLLVGADYEAPIIWRYDCVSHQDDDGTLYLVFDGGDLVLITLPVDPRAQIRWILPGQEGQHDVWRMRSE